MVDREKVFKGLEYCKNNQHANDCEKCSYGGISGTYCNRLIEDTIALLKEQEEKMKHLNNITLEYEKEVFRLQTLLKEQEAVEPTLIREGRNKYYSYYMCPRCDNEVVYDNNYCSECGVQFLWEGR